MNDRAISHPRAGIFLGDEARHGSRSRGGRYHHSQRERTLLHAT